MRLLTIVAVAAVAGGLYHYYQRQQAGHRPARRVGASDVQLARRVRAAIEAAVANPGRVDVRAAKGIVVLRGEVREVERDWVLAATLSVPGVMQVANHLESEPQSPEAAGIERGAMKSGMAGRHEPVGATKGSDPDLEGQPGFTGAPPRWPFAG
jgi:hypothetical protein